LQLIAFRHEDFGAGPVGCIEQERMIGLATDERAGQRLPAVYQPTGPWGTAGGHNKRMFVCTVCQTESLLIGTQYSINMSRAFMVFRDAKTKTLGMAPEPQIPLVACLHGFNQPDFEKCQSFFRLASESEMVQYLTARLAAFN
jgi:hypothetical protein